MISAAMKEKVGRPSAIRAMFEKGNELKKIHGADKVFDFSLGNPNLPPPKKVNETIVRLINENRPNLHGYMQNAGHEYVRERIAGKLSEEAGIKHDKNGIVLTCGAAAGINIVFNSILEPGDEVIAVAPFFVEYQAYAENHLGKIVVVNADPDTFLFDAGKIENALTDKTKAIILNSPNNPSGAVYPKNMLSELSEVLDRFENKTGRAVYVVSDEPYKELVYDGTEVPPMAGIFKNTISVYSFSKSLSLAGERIGYVAVSPGCDDYKDLVDALILSNRILGFVNAPALFQHVIAECLDSGVDVGAYKKKRDTLYGHITKLGFECYLPKGAFYLFPKSPIEDDAAFCNDYLLRHNILAAPGSGFGFGGYFRLAYCVGDEVIEGSLPVFEKLAKEMSL
ncbi:MAG: pyridoxal phosphate-dependent aminotransferase [Oscillospiraceae bacterium]|nr:pyridoxal phosphate-dependent aminotransferase [Oscillospiraceae bacterium]